MQSGWQLHAVCDSDSQGGSTSSCDWLGCATVYRPCQETRANNSRPCITILALEPGLPFACLLPGVQVKVFRCRKKTHSGLPCVRGRRALSTSSVPGVPQVGPDPAVAASPLPAPSSSGCVNPTACRSHSWERWDERRPSQAYFFGDEYAWFDGAR